MKFAINIYDEYTKLRGLPEFKKSIIYTSASVVAFGIVFIQNFLFAFLFSLDFYGKVTLVISVFTTLYTIFVFGLNTFILRFFFDKKYQENERDLISHTVVFWFLFGTIVNIFLLLVGYYLFEVKKLLDVDYFQEFIPLLMGAFFISFTEIFPSLFIVKERPFFYAYSLIAVRGSVFLFLTTSFYVYGESVPHFSHMLLYCGLTLSVIGFFIFKVFPITRILPKYLNEMFGFSFPLMIYALGGIGYSHGYRVIISNWLSFEHQAIFSFTNQLTQIYYLIVASILTGFYPKAYLALEQNNGNVKAIRFYFKLLLSLGIVLAIGMLPMVYVFLKYFKSGMFFSGMQIFPILLFGQFVFILYSYNYLLCAYHKKTKILTYSMIAGVSVSLLLASLLLNQSSVMMASLPILCGLITQFLISFILINSYVNKKKHIEKELNFDS